MLKIGLDTRVMLVNEAGKYANTSRLLTKSTVEELNMARNHSNELNPHTQQYFEAEGIGRAFVRSA